MGGETRGRVRGQPAGRYMEDRAVFHVKHDLADDALESRGTVKRRWLGLAGAPESAQRARVRMVCGRLTIPAQPQATHETSRDKTTRQ